MKKLLSLLPLLLVLYTLHVRFEGLKETSQTVAEIEEQQKVISRVETQKKQILTNLQGSDVDYLQKGSDAFSLLQPQIRRLQVGGYHQDISTLRANRLQWIPAGEQAALGFKETNFRLAQPTFMNADDLKKLLVFIEGVKIDPYIPKEKRPQLVIRDFELTRKMIGSEEVYAVQLELTQRTK
ncbi:MAG: hypothetical protein JSR58_01620 [Verrucomicrobia bacterium]|nr:hypothetical protein [Verrucomicrobiota bacterium]